MEDVGTYQKGDRSQSYHSRGYLEHEVEQRILEIISRDEIDMNVTYQEAREHYNLKEGRATKRRRRDGPSSQAPMVGTKGT